MEIEEILIQNLNINYQRTNIYYNCTVNESNKQFKMSPKTSSFGNCKICEDKATGIHYGIGTCEGL